MESDRVTSGDLVEVWFDDGRGGGPCYGVVTAAGDRAFYVTWESGARSRRPQGDHLVKPVRNVEVAREALGKAGLYPITARVRLTPARRAILTAANVRPDGHVVGGDPRARQALLDDGLLEVYDRHFGPLLQITDAGRAALKSCS